MRQLPGTTKVWFFLLFLTLMFLVIGYRLADRTGLFLAFIFSVTFIVLIYFYGDSQLLKRLKADPVLGNDPWGLQALLKKFSLVLQIPTPELYIVPHSGSFAFSLGNQGRVGSICISSGLLSRLNPTEVEAVIAHQACHIRQINTFWLGVAHLLAFALLGLGRVLDAILPLRLIKKGHHPFTSFFAPLSWLIIRLAVSEKLYFQNDDMASALLHDRKTLAEALWKLESLNQATPISLPPCNSHFFIVNPTPLREKNWFLLAHPKIEIRIKRLIGYFPI